MVTVLPETVATEVFELLYDIAKPELENPVKVNGASLNDFEGNASNVIVWLALFTVSERLISEAAL